MKPTAATVRGWWQLPIWVCLISGLCSVAGCTAKPSGGKPDLRVEDILGVTFQASGQSWAASPSEIVRLVTAYQRAEVRHDDLGTTPPAVADVLLKTGEMLRIWGGSEGVQGLWCGEQELDLRGEELGELLTEVVARAERPGAAGSH